MLNGTVWKFRTRTAWRAVPERYGPWHMLRRWSDQQVHLVCDAFGRPLAFVLTGGDTNDCTQFTTVTEAIRVPRMGPGPSPGTAHPDAGRQGLQLPSDTDWLRRRGIATRYDKTAESYRAAVTLASLLMWA
ncbi:hypothetical protein ACFSL1_01330 [Streptomyces lienomycini]|uniref:Transposase n=1 Tax=Streptomyces lienomycini TaxID=284035 RepID=A0ABV9X4X9_9ACTN